MTNWSHQGSYDQLTQFDHATRLLFIHPHYRQQKRLLHSMLQSDMTSYVCFEGTGISYDDMHTQVQSVVDRDHSDNHFNMLILDECDKVNPDDFDEFLTYLVDHYQQAQIVVVSRTVAYNTIQNAELRSQSRFLPADESMMLFDYAQRSDERMLIEVRAFGSGRVYVQGKPIEEWDGILPRLLFFYLADRGMVTRNDIFSTFWPDMLVKEATNVFHVTKRKISEILNVNFTKYWSGFYRVAPHIELSYDVIRFSELIQTSVISEPKEAVKLLEQAIALYRSPFLNSFDIDAPAWILGRRSELRDMYGEALSLLANFKHEEGDLERALGLYLLASKITPYREDLIESAMRIYRGFGQLDDALELYRWLSHNLDEHLSVVPGDSVQELALEIETKLR